MPYERQPRSNFELYDDEYINLTYMNSVWLGWVITQQKLGGCRIGGQEVDHAFSSQQNLMSQTTEEPISLYESAKEAQREIKLNLGALECMGKPKLLSERQWDEVLKRKEKLENAVK